MSNASVLSDMMMTMIVAMTFYDAGDDGDDADAGGCRSSNIGGCRWVVTMLMMLVVVPAIGGSRWVCVPTDSVVCCKPPEKPVVPASNPKPLYNPEAPYALLNNRPRPSPPPRPNDGP